MSIDVSVVIPTYREAANLAVLIPRVDRSLRAAGLRYEAIVVDDDSDDGTEQVCALLSREYPVRLILRRRERGLASAVIRGMTEAQGNLLVSLNADLSHPPEKIPELVAALADPGVDFAIGSRYVPGAVISEEWSFWRGVISRVATALARPLTAAKDPLSGFYALRSETFETASPYRGLGFKNGLELIVRGRCEQVVEIPITFSPRLHGASKMRPRHMAFYLIQVVLLMGLKLRSLGSARHPHPQSAGDNDGEGDNRQAIRREPSGAKPGA